MKIEEGDVFLVAAIGVSYYVVFDPFREIQDEKNMDKALLRVWKLSESWYTELTTPVGIREVGEWIWLEEVGLGLKLWSGNFEEKHVRLWLRWCDFHGEVIPTALET
jgi:hypothetical protein